MAGSRRARAAGGRPHQITVWLSEAELDAVSAAADRAGMAPGAWLGEAGVRAAEAGTPEARVSGGLAALAPLYSELMEHRRVLRNVGGNLNDVARHANATGVLHPSTQRVEWLVTRVVERVDVAVEQVERLARETRAERGRAGRRRMAAVADGGRARPRGDAEAPARVGRAAGGPVASGGGRGPDGRVTSGGRPDGHPDGQDRNGGQS